MERRRFGIVLLMVGLFTLPFCVALHADDDRDSGDGHHGGPCTLLTNGHDDGHGEARGIAKHCKFGGSTGIVKGDFNGDGIADLAIGVPNETRTRISLGTGFPPTSTAVAAPGAGVVIILFGSANGLSGSSSQVLDGAPAGLPDNSHFGAALVAGKFRDVTSPYSDLAVGVPGIAGTHSKGAVFVYYNQNGTLTNLNINGATAGFLASDLDTHGTDFGGFAVSFPPNMSMTWGDFDGDGFGDLAVEVNNCPTCTNPPGKSGVVIYFGGPFGLSASRHVILTLDDGFSPNNLTTNGANCDTRFCATATGHVSLTSADLNGDGIDELLIGAPGCTQLHVSQSPTVSEGCVAIVPGKTGGPSQVFGWGALIGDKLKAFGSSIAVGDFDGNGHKDIAVGQSGVLPGRTPVAGAVQIFSNPTFPSPISGEISDQSILNVQPTLINQGTSGIGGTQSDGAFGATLAVNDFNGDGASDLAIGAPGETVSGVADSGVVTVIYGLSGVGLSTSPSANRPPAQNVMPLDLGGAAGTSLTAWNFGKSAQPDLVIGAPLTTITQFIRNPIGRPTVITTNEAGNITVVYGSPTGLDIGNPQFLDEAFIPGQSLGSGNHFGASVY